MRSVRRTRVPSRGTLTALLQSVYGRNVGMIQGRQYTRFTLKPCYSFSIMRKAFRKEFDRNTAAELRDGGLIDLSPCRPNPSGS
jgi:hypothetical protein